MRLITRFFAVSAAALAILACSRDGRAATEAPKAASPGSQQQLFRRLRARPRRRPSRTSPCRPRSRRSSTSCGRWS